MKNSVDPDQTADLGLRCLFVYLNQSVVFICSRRLQQTTFSVAFSSSLKWSYITNSVDPDQTADLGLRCLLVYLNQSVVFICSRRLQQTTCSDACFAIALMVLYDKQCGPRSDC